MCREIEFKPGTTLNFPHFHTVESTVCCGWRQIGQWPGQRLGNGGNLCDPSGKEGACSWLGTSAAIL
jgi:hypothetical protein